MRYNLIGGLSESACAAALIDAWRSASEARRGLIRDGDGHGSTSSSSSSRKGTVVYAPEIESLPFAISRLGTIMQPLPYEPREAWGVLNPACARGRDGQLYLFPRIVGEGNYSRIALCRVRFGTQGNPVGVDRLAIALEPQASYECTPHSGGGCEDPRITYVPLLDRYIMTYTALSGMGPRVALAISHDLFLWQRLGLADFAPERGLDWNAQSDKDALLFPEPVMDTNGKPALALLHRPTFLCSDMDGTVTMTLPDGLEDCRESIWISYASLDAVKRDVRAIAQLTQHRLVAAPRADWESVKIGGGAPPLATHLGWLLLYHGVGGVLHPVTAEDATQKHLRYSAGAMVLDRTNPLHVLYRSPQPILEPTTPQEREGIVSNVVFPTALDARMSPGPGTVVDVYYGQADTTIGAGRFTLPATLPQA